MAHYVLSDIHGEADRFRRMLQKIRFSEADILYILGDVIDRGLDGVPLLQQIMASPNMVMLLGNHEYMCLQCFRPEVTELDFRRWGRNGNYPTLSAMEQLEPRQLAEILTFLEGLPTHLEVTVNDRRFYLVHGFPGENVHDEVWSRPETDTPNPRPDCCLIVGHTPVLNMMGSEKEQAVRGAEMEAKGEHLRIFHGPNFMDIDCGCGHRLPIKALACLRLEDMAEFYT